MDRKELIRLVLIRRLYKKRNLKQPGTWDWEPHFFKMIREKEVGWYLALSEDTPLWHYIDCGKVRCGVFIQDVFSGPFAELPDELLHCQICVGGEND